MARPRMLYASPFPPMKSGIADYSASLVQGLRGEFDVTLLTDAYDVTDPALVDDFEILRIDRDPIPWEKYEVKLYNIGNNPWFHRYIYQYALRYPDTVILHDYVLYYLVVGHHMDEPGFFAKMFQLGGPVIVDALKGMLRSGFPFLEYRSPARFPLNADLLTSGNRFLCHSRYAIERCREAGPRDIRISHLPMALWEGGLPRSRSRSELLASLSIPDDAVVVVSFGYVAPTKLNHVVCEAVRRVNEVTRAGKVFYVMVGEGEYVRGVMDEHMRITGFTDLETFREWIAAGDLVVNLRYPSMGETSLAAIQVLGAGKPCIVTDSAWFSELPDDAVLKIRIREGEGAVCALAEAIQMFLDFPGLFYEMGRQAEAYIEREHSRSYVARRLAEFVQDERGRGVE